MREAEKMSCFRGRFHPLAGVTARFGVNEFIFDKNDFTRSLDDKEFEKITILCF